MDLLYQCLISATVIIPLVVALIIYVKKAFREKNWRALVKIMYALVIEAEQKFLEQADKTEYIVAMTMAAAREIGYSIDEQSIRDFVIDIINLTNDVNSIKCGQFNNTREKKG